MRIAVIGTGAVGGYFGGRLAQAGNEVVFLSRGRALEALRARGLVVQSIKGDFTVQPALVAEGPEEIGPVDVVLVAVKTWQVPGLGPHLAPLMGPDTMVLPLQNGVEAPAQLSATLGEEHVLGGLCRIIAFVTEPGTIKHAGAEPEVTLGELDGRPSARLDRLADALRAAGVLVQTPPNIQAAMWEKLLFIAAFGGMGAVTRAPIGVVRSIAGTRRMLTQAMVEAREVAAARGVGLAREVVETTMAYVDALPAAGTSSLQRDIAEGRPSELDALSGAIVRLGREARVETPIHAFIYDSLLPGELKVRGRLSYPT